MKNSTLIFRSIAVIIFIAGGAHLVSYASQTTNFNYQDSINKTYELDNNESSDVNFIVGKWKVNYNSKEFKGAIVYNLLKEGKKFNAYIYKYLDENGYEQKAEKQKVLTISSFDGYKGKGIYKIEYEGKTYDVKCTIDMVDENTFKLSYDYYGYSDIETWKKQ